MSVYKLQPAKQIAKTFKLVWSANEFKSKTFFFAGLAIKTTWRQLDHPLEEPNVWNENGKETHIYESIESTRLPMVVFQMIAVN